MLGSQFGQKIQICTAKPEVTITAENRATYSGCKLEISEFGQKMQNCTVNREVMITAEKRATYSG